jgi:hypothetical protein
MISSSPRPRIGFLAKLWARDPCNMIARNELEIFQPVVSGRPVRVYLPSEGGRD